MAKYFSDNSYSTGRTPLVRLNRVVQNQGTILAKVEGRNPACSVKCRIGAAMIRDAEDKGFLGPGKEVIEATSGNMGIALACVTAARKIPLTLAMPETVGQERRRILEIFGAKIVLTPADAGMLGAIKKVDQIVADDPQRYYLPLQFENPANPAIHERTTGPEIWDDTDGEVDALVAGVGTGGTITGISRYFKLTKRKKIVSVAVEPKESCVLSQHLAGRLPTPGQHRILGLGAGFIPETLDLSLIDQVQAIGSQEAIEYTRRLAREEGLFCGISSGAAVAAVGKLCNLPEFHKKTIVVVLPDAGDRYLTTTLLEEPA